MAKGSRGGKRATNNYQETVNNLPVIDVNDDWVFNPNNADFYINPNDIVENPIKFVGIGNDAILMDKLDNGVIRTSYENDVEVKIADLQTLQPFVLKSGLLKNTGDGEQPYVYEYKGNLYLIDGNHRVAREKLQGKKKVKVIVDHVIDIT